MSSASHAHFLLLPLELRDRIYDLLLLSEPSEDPSFILNARNIQVRGLDEIHTLPVGCLGLIRTNRQIHREFFDYVQFCQKAKKPLRYEASLFLANETLYSLSWTHVPIRLKHIDICKVTMKLLGVRSGFSGFRGDGFAVPQVVRSFHEIIFLILRHGPQLSTKCSAPMTVGRLDLDIRTPDMIPEGYELLPVEDFSDLRDVGRGVINPRTVANEMAVHTAWRMGHKPIEKTWLLEEAAKKLGEFRILVDGEPIYVCSLLTLWNDLWHYDYASQSDILELMEREKEKARNASR